MRASRAALRRIDAFVARLRRCSGGRGSDAVRAVVEEMVSSFEVAMESDLNVPMALASIFILIRKINKIFATGELSKEDASLVLDALQRINSVLAIFDFNPSAAVSDDPEIETLVEAREQARERKDFELADRIREELKKRGVTLEDTPYGTFFWIEDKVEKG